MDQTTSSLILLLVFCAGALLIYAIYSFWNQYFSVAEKDKVKQRIDQMSRAGSEASGEKRLSLARQKVISPLDRILLEIPGYHRFDHFLEQSGAKYAPGGALIRTLIAGAVGMFLANFVLGGLGVLALPVGFIVGILFPLVRLRRQRSRRLALLVRQLPDAMDFFARSLRAGNPFVGALKSAPQEMAQPIAREFEITFEEMNYGLDFEEVMQNLASRVDAEEVRFFVTAVLVQKTTGGNLAEIMNRIAALLRERIKTRGEVQVLAAEMKTSSHVLIGLPFFIAGVLQLLSPDYFRILFENPTGRVIIVIQLTMMLVGYLIMRRMVNFRI